MVVWIGGLVEHKVWLCDLCIAVVEIQLCIHLQIQIASHYFLHQFPFSVVNLNPFFVTLAMQRANLVFLVTNEEGLWIVDELMKNVLPENVKSI